MGGKTFEGKTFEGKGVVADFSPSLAATMEAVPAAKAPCINSRR
jgi:hypothetical protein